MYPLITIAIPTYNSEKTLAKVLTAVRRQTYPQTSLEILVIDGGSNDNSVSIAEKFKCKIVPNPQTDLIYAKHIAYLIAKGKYLLNMDSDEVLENNNSIMKRYLTFASDKRIKGIMPTGFKTPPEYPMINHYINDFGDPFSYFIYRMSQHPKFYIPLLKGRGQVVLENKDFVAIKFLHTKKTPLVELWASTGIIDLQYFRRNFPEIKLNLEHVSFYFYLLTKDDKLLAVTKNDTVIHYSAGTLKKYLRKIVSRVKNNTFSTTMGKGGFSGREEYQNSWFRFKKYLFIPYSFSIVLPLVDALFLLVTRRKLVYLTHPLLCIYTSSLIAYFELLKLLGVKPKMGSYGN